jgi:hypothetical protein
MPGGDRMLRSTTPAGGVGRRRLLRNALARRPPGRDRRGGHGLTRVHRCGRPGTAVDGHATAPLLGSATGHLVVHVDGPVPRRFVSRGLRCTGRRMLLRLILISLRNDGPSPARTAHRRRAGRRGSTTGRLVDRCVHGFAAARVAGVALSGQRFPLPGDLVDPGGLVVPAVARPGAPAVHRATHGWPVEWQRSVTANSTCQKLSRARPRDPRRVSRLRRGGLERRLTAWTSETPACRRSLDSVRSAPPSLLSVR